MSKMTCDVCGAEGVSVNYGDAHTVICRSCSGTEKASRVIEQRLTKRLEESSFYEEVIDGDDPETDEEETAKTLGLEVVHVNSDSKLQGLVRPGERIIAYDGVLVKAVADLRSAVSQAGNDGTVKLTVWGDQGQTVLEIPSGPLGVRLRPVPFSRPSYKVKTLGGHLTEWKDLLRKIRRPHERRMEEVPRMERVMFKESPKPGSVTHPGFQESGTERPSSMPALTHVIALFTGFLGPLLILAVSENEEVKAHARLAFNWQMSLLIYVLISLALIFAVVGIILLPLLVIIDIGFSITATVHASRGKLWVYPLAIGFLGGKHQSSPQVIKETPEDLGPDVLEQIDSPRLTGEKRVLQVYRDGALEDLEFEIGESGEVYYIPDVLPGVVAKQVKRELQERYPFVDFSLVRWSNRSDPFQAARVGIRGRANGR